MIVQHKVFKTPYKAKLERVPIITSNAKYDEWYVRLTEVNGIKSDLCPYTEAVKRYNFPKPRV